MTPPPPASPLELVGIAAAIVAGFFFASALLASALWFSKNDRDLAHFDSLRKTDPVRFRNMVWVSRINCPLVLLMTLAGVVAFPLGVLNDQSIPWFLLRTAIALGGVLLAIGFMYLSWRWSRWGWRTSLRQKQD